MTFAPFSVTVLCTFFCRAGKTLSGGGIFEFKTAASTPSQTEADSSIQLTAYALAYHFLYDQPPESLCLVALVKTQQPKVISLQTIRCQKEFHNLVEMGIEIARAIEANIFYRNCETRWGCHSCEYEMICLGLPPQKEG